MYHTSWEKGKIKFETVWVTIIENDGGIQEERPPLTTSTRWPTTKTNNRGGEKELMSLLPVKGHVPSLNEKKAYHWGSRFRTSREQCGNNKLSGKSEKRRKEGRRAVDYDRGVSYKRT